MKKIIILALLGFFAGTQMNAQERECATMDNLSYRMAEDPGLEQRMQQIELYTQQKIREMSGNREINGSIISIPVVVHVLYSNTNENISVAQIQSQLDVMNEDFRRTNSDADGTWPQAADTEIEFCLAAEDPSGNATNGITRKSSSTTSWGTNDAMKSSAQGGVDAWDTSQYLNMWVCNIGGGILGYAQFPGGNSSTDGVVMGPNYFGSSAKGSGFYLSAPFDLGRTTTHEVGHFLNLRHIWGDTGCGGDDFVTDTPLSDAANYGCATTHSSCGSLDMVQNYMDYSDDGCMNLYTQGQTDRMRTVLLPGGSRASLGASTKCSPGVPPTCDDGIQNGDETGVDCGGTTCEPCIISCAEGDIELTITFDNYPEETGWTLVNSGGTVASADYTTSNPDGSTVTETFSGLANDDYTFTMTDSYGDGMCCAFGNGSYTLSDDNGVIVSGGTFGSSEATDFCIDNEPVATCDDGIQNGDETGVDCGGTECAPCNTTATLLHEGYFETGWDGWISIGDDSDRYFGRRSYEGDYSIRLKDNSNSSTMTLKNVRLNESYATIDVDFYFKAIGMDAGETFQVEYYDGSTWNTVAVFEEGVDYVNKTFYNANVTISSAEFNFPTRPRFKFRSNGSGNNDHVYIDQVTIYGNQNVVRSGQTITALETIDGLRDSGESLNTFVLYPNPANSILNIRLLNPSENSKYQIVNMLGQVVLQGILNNETTVEVSKLQSGVYFVEVNDGEDSSIKRFVKN